LPIRDNGAASRARPLPLFGAAGLALALLLAATVALWMHYGTAVFYETMAAALAACL
jgi:membrane-associated phospholipid phosphatase